MGKSGGHQESLMGQSGGHQESLRGQSGVIRSHISRLRVEGRGLIWVIHERQLPICGFHFTCRSETAETERRV